MDKNRGLCTRAKLCSLELSSVSSISFAHVNPQIHFRKKDSVCCQTVRKKKRKKVAKLNKSSRLVLLLFGTLGRVWLADRRGGVRRPLANLVGVIVDTAEAGSAIVRRLVPLFAA